MGILANSCKDLLTKLASLCGMGVLQSDKLLIVDSKNKEDVEMVLSAYRSVLSDISYASMPITSGRRYYDVLEEYNAKTLDELVKKDKHALARKILEPNLEEGLAFAKGLTGKTHYPIVAPAVFEATRKGWSQDDYMFLWYRVIEEKAMQLHFMDGWEYSNGAVDEFVRGIQMQFRLIENLHNSLYDSRLDMAKQFERFLKLRLFSEQGKELRIDHGIQMISYALLDIEKRGFNIEHLAQALYKLYAVGIGGMYSLSDERPYDYIPPHRIEVFKNNLHDRLFELAHSKNNEE